MRANIIMFDRENILKADESGIMPIADRTHLQGYVNSENRLFVVHHLPGAGSPVRLFWSLSRDLEGVKLDIRRNLS